MNKKCVVIILMACALVLGGCLSPWKGDEGTISISIGEAAGRTVTADTDGRLHTITLSGGPGPRQEQTNIAYGTTVYFSAAPGWWDITVTAYQDDALYASGFSRVNIKPGPNGAIPIPMIVNVEPQQPSTVTVDPGEIEDKDIILTGAPITIVNINDSPITITVVESYASYQWYIDGILLLDNVNGDDFFPRDIQYELGPHQLTISYLPPGTHRVTVAVIDNGKPYSKTVEFTVEK